MAWDLLIDRADLAHTELVDAAPVDPSDGQVVLQVDRVGMTANNVTYAVFGDAMKYWDFFPAGERDGVAYGRVPLWGFAVVERSTVAGVEEGDPLLRVPAHEQPPGGRADRCRTEGVPRREPAPPAPPARRTTGSPPRPATSPTTRTSRTSRSSTGRCS